MIFLSLILHAFHAFRPRFWVFLKFLKIDEYFVKFLGWVLLIWYYMLMHCITFACSQCFMHYRCVFICWKLCAFRIGLGWTHDAIFFACHMLMYCSCIQTFSFQYSSTLCDGVSLSLSLSLSLMVCVWHPSANSLRLKTLFVLRHLLLILLLFTFSSVMSWLPGLLRELLQMWHSFGMPRNSIGLFQYYSTYCYS